MSDQPTYVIRVQGTISQRWVAWFDSMAIAVTGEADAGQAGKPATITSLTGTVADQAALHGLLQKLYTLGLPLLEVKRKKASHVDDVTRD